MQANSVDLGGEEAAVAPLLEERAPHRVEAARDALLQLAGALAQRPVLALQRLQPLGGGARRLARLAEPLRHGDHVAQVVHAVAEVGELLAQRREVAHLVGDAGGRLQFLLELVHDEGGAPGVAALGGQDVAVDVVADVEHLLARGVEEVHQAVARAAAVHPAPGRHGHLVPLAAVLGDRHERAFGAEEAGLARRGDHQVEKLAPAAEPGSERSKRCEQSASV